MNTQQQVEKKWALASIPLQDAYTDFLLSRQAMMCTPRTIQFYEFTLEKYQNGLKEMMCINHRKSQVGM